MVAKSFVVAMAADIARSDYAKPTLIRSRSREWLIGKLDLDVRGFYRDLQFLKDIGITVSLGEGGYVLSEGSEAKLREYVAVAKRDYRDALFWAEHPDEAKLDTPEKRQQLRELFEKLGMEPPTNLFE